MSAPNSTRNLLLLNKQETPGFIFLVTIIMKNNYLNNPFKTPGNTNLRAIFSDQKYLSAHLAHTRKIVDDMNGDVIKLDFNETTNFEDFTLLRDEFLLYLNNRRSESKSSEYYGGEIVFKIILSFLPQDIRSRLILSQSNYTDINAFFAELFTTLSERQEECEECIEFLSRLGDVLVSGQSDCNRRVQISHLLKMIDAIRFNYVRRSNAKPVAVLLFNFRFDLSDENMLCIQVCLNDLYQNCRANQVSFQEIVTSNELIPVETTDVVLDESYMNSKSNISETAIYDIELKSIKTILNEHFRTHYIPTLQVKFLDMLLSPIKFRSMILALNQSRFNISSGLRNHYVKRPILQELIMDKEFQAFETEIRLLIKLAK